MCAKLKLVEINPPAAVAQADHAFTLHLGLLSAGCAWNFCVIFSALSTMA
jgi:hypothetical protein